MNPDMAPRGVPLLPIDGSGIGAAADMSAATPWPASGAFTQSRQGL